MGDTFGALTLPIQVPATSETVADPALDAIAAYLQAMLVTYAGAAWAARSPTVPIVRSVSTNDPKNSDFSDKTLPALFVYRNSVTPERLADEILIDHGRIQILWVYAPATQVKQSSRSSIVNAIGRIVAYAVDRERDPCYIAADDTDPDKVSLGTQVCRRAGIAWWWTGPAKPATLTIADPAMGGPIEYDAVAVEIETKEIRERDPATWGIAPTAVTLDITFSDDSVYGEDSIPYPVVYA